MSYPILSTHEKFINIGLYKCDYSLEGTDYPEPWVKDVSSEDLASLYTGWESDVQAILKVRSTRHVLLAYTYAHVSAWIRLWVDGLSARYPIYHSSTCLVL